MLHNEVIKPLVQEYRLSALRTDLKGLTSELSCKIKFKKHNILTTKFDLQHKRDQDLNICYEY